MDKISYALGLSIGNNLKTSGVQGFVLSDFTKAIEDVFAGNKPELSYEEAGAAINEYFSKLQAEKKEINKKAGAEFLAANRGKEGVVELPDGLQYRILKEGTGPKPKETDQVKCHYEGRLIDGRIFDSSIKRGQPTTFGLMQVIPGWTEALQLMPVGSKWELFIPSELAYGENQPGELIEPNSTLIFEVELLEII